MLGIFRVCGCQEILLVFRGRIPNLLHMSFLRGLLWHSLLREGPVHPEAVVLLAAVDDGGAVLLWGGLLHPETHVPLPPQRGPCLQRLLHQAAGHHASFPATEHAGLRPPRDPRLPHPTRPRPHDDLIPPAPHLLQPPAPTLRTGVQQCRQEVTVETTTKMAAWRRDGGCGGVVHSVISTIPGSASW